MSMKNVKQSVLHLLTKRRAGGLELCTRLRCNSGTVYSVQSTVQEHWFRRARTVSSKSAASALLRGAYAVSDLERREGPKTEASAAGPLESALKSCDFDCSTPSCPSRTAYTSAALGRAPGCVCVQACHRSKMACGQSSGTLRTKVQPLAHVHNQQL